MKISNDPIGNRNLGLPACSTVPHPTLPLYNLHMYVLRKYLQGICASTACNIPHRQMDCHLHKRVFLR